MVITEALAEMKTLVKRIAKKQEAIVPYLLRQIIVLDPLTESGGSKEYIRRELQAIADLETRMVAIRTGIQKINHVTTITVENQTKTIAEWLTWRKEVAPTRQRYLTTLSGTIGRVRADQLKKGGSVGEQVTAADHNVVINLDELALLKDIEQMENILGQLDGQLSLKNATVLIELAE